MTPLHIVARLAGAVAERSTSTMLDGLLAWAVALTLGLDPLGPIVQVEIPIQRSTCGRFHLCSQAFGRVEEQELRWKNQRFPLAEAQLLGSSKMRSLNLQSGPCRSYRVPLGTAHLVADRLEWWAIGDREEVTRLLAWVGYVGHRRAVGLGRVLEWIVEPCEPWGDGFPVVRDGLPTRPLPADWPGVREDAERAYAALSYPYWRRTEQELCAVPSWT